MYQKHKKKKIVESNDVYPQINHIIQFVFPK